MALGWALQVVVFFRIFHVFPKTANFVVRYTKKETNAEMKEGQQEARELSASNYGCNEWWLLLEPTAEPSAKRLRR